MIQRALFRQSRRALSCSTRFSQLSPFARSQRPVGLFQQLGRNPATASRWYSSETEATTGPEGKTTTADSAEAESKEVEDPLKKELETKNREILELKVGFPP